MAQDLHHALPAGYRLEEYEIDSVLGHGGFGVTYLARDLNLGSQVAIKEYLPNDLAVRTDGASIQPKSGADEEEFRWGLDRFVGEAQTLARFKHPNIVPILRFFEANNTAYLVMEYQDGESLSEVLRNKGKLGEAELMALLEPLLDGLAEVHAAGFLHRDIKPANIYIRRDGAPVLIDFGAARQAITQKTKSLTAIVTAGYAPQEQYFTGGNQGPWTDIYALGGVLYRAIVGMTPVEAPQRASAVMAEDPDPLTPAAQAARGKCAAPVLAAIDWALQIREKDRPQSIADWRESLSGARVPTVTSTTRAARGGGARRIAASVALAAAVLGGGFALWPQMRGDSSGPALSKTQVAASSSPAAINTGAADAGDDIRRREDEVRRADAEIRQQEEEIKRANEELKRKEEERRRAEEESHRKAEEAQRAIEEARRVEDEARRKAEVDDRRKAEADARRQAEMNERLKELERRAQDAEQRARSAGTQTAKADPSSPAGLKAMFAGGSVHKSATNKQYKIDFRADGSLSAVLFEEGGWGAITEHTDTGAWTVEGQKLCLRWKNWDGGKKLCYAIAGDGPEYTASGAGGVVAGSFRLVR